MMFELVQIFSLCGNLGFLAVVLYTVYRGGLREAYAILWIFICLVMVTLSLSMRLLSVFAHMLGIKTPAFALLACMVMGLLLLVFQLTVVISSHSRKINRLTQEVALLREELDRKK
jgi:hypothetical protein